MPRPFDALRSPEPSSSPSSPDEACNPQRLKLIAKFLSATLLVAVLGKSLAIAAPVIQKKASPESAGMSGEPMRILIERFTADRNSVSAVYTDQLSPATIARVTALDRDARQQLEQIKFDALDQEGKVDYLLFAHYLTQREHERAIDQKQWASTEPLLPFAATIFALEDQKRLMQRPNMEQTAAQLNDAIKKLKALQPKDNPPSNPNTDASKAPRPSHTESERIVAFRAAEETAALRDRLHAWFEFRNHYDPEFTWWVAKPYQEVDEALKTYSTYLREQVAGISPDDKSSVIGMPIGRDALLAQLKDENIPYTPEELIAGANVEMAWCKREMLKASREMGFGDDWHAALEKVKKSYVDAGKQPELIRDLALEGEQFAEQQNLVTIPALAKETWGMDMMTPEHQLVNPFFTGGDKITVSYPTDSMEYDQRMMSMRGNNIYFSRATVFHELIPGHWLQEFSEARYRPYRALFDTGFWVEGNALYWEMTFWDHGFHKTPEQRVGALFWRMHRCARVVFSLSFQLGKMTPGEAVDYLVSEVGHERDNAVAEVRRSVNGSYDPLYQCAYLLGALQFRALHHELVDTGKMTDRAFNDDVLHENVMPVVYLRAILNHETLTRDWSPEWRFLDEAFSVVKQ